MKQKTFLQVVGTIFSVVTVMHALRLVLGWEVNFAGLEVPVWFSVVGVVVASYLAYSAFKFAK